jgi:hypothetical protein
MAQQGVGMPVEIGQGKEKLSTVDADHHFIQLVRHVHHADMAAGNAFHIAGGGVGGGFGGFASTDL